MDKCCLLLSLLALILGIVNAQEIVNYEFKFRAALEDAHVNQTRIRRGTGDHFDCPNTNLLTVFAKDLQDDIDIFWSYTSTIFGYDLYMSSFYDDAIQLTLISHTGKEFSKRLIAENKRLNTAALKNSDFTPQRKTVIIVHGFMSNEKADWVNYMAHAYLNYEPVNLIVVDWSTISHFSLGYIQAAKNTIEAAKQVGELAKAIVETFPNVTWGPIHLIGHSLGAHVAGMIGDHFKKQSNTSSPLAQWRVDRITGLDPAHPCFTDTEFVLDKEDAPFVDIIHTSGNRAFAATLGMLKPTGHVDFYPNGGEIQPGCLLHIPRFLSTELKVPSSIYSSYCSHLIATDYFIESLEVVTHELQKALLTGIKWDYDFCAALFYTYSNEYDENRQRMGITADRNQPGSYFIPTARKSPFYNIQNDDRQEIAAELERLRELGKPDYI